MVGGSLVLIEIENHGRIDEVVEVVESGLVFLVLVQEAKLVRVPEVVSRGVEGSISDEGSQEVSVCSFGPHENATPGVGIKRELHAGGLTN
ncbi:hypothetical protein V6N12_010565 [Hibiscus sabdariffa]|uniref:Uncharacterized protein n=1 Tax=Hibiscus sabdariffa TaxID=183260 RepID=A0ABR2EMU4_9ROSI